MKAYTLITSSYGVRIQDLEGDFCDMMYHTSHSYSVREFVTDGFRYDARDVYTCVEDAHVAANRYINSCRVDAERALDQANKMSVLYA